MGLLDGCCLEFLSRFRFFHCLTPYTSNWRQLATRCRKLGVLARVIDCSDDRLCIRENERKPEKSMEIGPLEA